MWFLRAFKTPSVRTVARNPVPRVYSFAAKALAIFLLWTIIGLLLAVPEELKGLNWPDVASKVIEAWAWAVLTPPVLYAIRKLGRLDPKPLLHGAVLFLLTIPFSLAHVYLTAVLLYPMSSIWWNPLRTPQFISYYFIGGWLTCCAMIGIVQAVRYQRNFLAGQLELERIEKRLLQSHLNVLRMQLEPHFLFNTLNSISSELASNPALARNMIEDLGALLRLSLDYKNDQEIPLANEIALLEHYLAIQRVRFGRRLKVELLISPDVTTALIPCMLLQPIVENAIRHGLATRTSGGTVTVLAERAGDTVEIRVLDDGIGLPPGWQMDGCEGLGIRVTRERLTGLYPGVANSFEIHGRASGGAEVILRVPMQNAVASHNSESVGEDVA